MKIIKLFDEYRYFNTEWWNDRKKDPNEPFFNKNKNKYKRKEELERKKLEMKTELIEQLLFIIIIFMVVLMISR